MKDASTPGLPAQSNELSVFHIRVDHGLGQIAPSDPLLQQQLHRRQIGKPPWLYEPAAIKRCAGKSIRQHKLRAFGLAGGSASPSQQMAWRADRHKVDRADADRLDIVGQRFAWKQSANADRNRPSEYKLRDCARRLNPNMHRHGWESHPERFNRIDDTRRWKHSIQSDENLRLEHLAQASHLRGQANDVGDNRPRLGEHRPAGLRQQRPSGFVPHEERDPKLRLQLSDRITDDGRRAPNLPSRSRKAPLVYDHQKHSQLRDRRCRRIKPADAIRRPSQLRPALSSSLHRQASEARTSFAKLTKN